MDSAFQEFAPFSRLPPEIRHHILSLTLPTTPQLIPYAATKTPIISKINRESRAVFLSIYTKTFIPAGRKEDGLLFYHSSLYANLSLDILFFQWDMVPSDRYPYPLHTWLTPEAFQKLQHVAIIRSRWKIGSCSVTGRPYKNRKKLGTIPWHMREFEGIKSWTFVKILREEADDFQNERKQIRSLDGMMLVEVGEEHANWEDHRKWLEDHVQLEWCWKEKPRVASAEIVNIDCL